MSLPNNLLSQLYAELEKLDDEFSLSHEGTELKASHCYYVGANPLHVLFNSNCPDELRERVKEIISRYQTNDSARM